MEQSMHYSNNINYQLEMSEIMLQNKRFKLAEQDHIKIDTGTYQTFHARF